MSRRERPPFPFFLFFPPRFIGRFLRDARGSTHRRFVDLFFSRRQPISHLHSDVVRRFLLLRQNATFLSEPLSASRGKKRRAQPRVRRVFRPGSSGPASRFSCGSPGARRLSGRIKTHRVRRNETRAGRACTASFRSSVINKKEETKKRGNRTYGSISLVVREEAWTGQAEQRNCADGKLRAKIVVVSRESNLFLPHVTFHRLLP